MTQPIADRVKDATLTTGTANVVLTNTAPAGYVTFLAGFGSSVSRDVCYCISNPNSPYEWETGFGSYTSSTNTLARGTVTANYLGTQPTKISFPAGTKDVFCTTPSKSMLVMAGTGVVEIPNSGFSNSIATSVNSSGFVPPGLSILCVTPTAAAQTGTYFELVAGEGTTTGDGGYFALVGGNAPGAGAGGFVQVFGGGSATGLGGDVQIIGGDGGTGGGGPISITAGGVSASYTGNGGDITIDAGIALGSGSNGSISLTLATQPAITIQPADATTTAAAKIGLFNATPVVRPTTANTTAGTFVVNSGTAVNTGSTFSGYTVGQIAAALVKLGILT